jgi:hypothetical protein
MSNNQELPDRMASESKPVRLLGAVAAAAVAAPSALAVIPGVPSWVAAATGAVGLLLTIALAKYTGDTTTPWQDVVAKKTPDGDVVAGPASPIRTGAAVEVSLPEETKE